MGTDAAPPHLPVHRDVSGRLAAMRREYARVGLTEDELAPTWLDQFHRWLAEVTDIGLAEPNAMVLATADAAGRPSARTVLLKSVDERGLVCYTNYESRKAAEAAVNPYASVVFPWHEVGRQVVACGWVDRVDRAETEAYFATRPRPAQLSAWASRQSRVVAGRGELEAAVADLSRRYGTGEIPAPPFWGGLRVVPHTVEFWQGRTARLHDRLRYRRADGGWVIERLAP